MTSEDPTRAYAGFKATVAETPGLPVLMAMAPFEGIDIGIDRRSPVSWAVYERHGPFPYTGTLHSVTYYPWGVCSRRRSPLAGRPTGNSRPVRVAVAV